MAPRIVSYSLYLYVIRPWQIAIFCQGRFLFSKSLAQNKNQWSFPVLRQSESKTHKQHLFLSEGNDYEKREHPIQNLSEWIRDAKGNKRWWLSFIAYLIRFRIKYSFYKYPMICKRGSFRYLSHLISYSAFSWHAVYATVCSRINPTQRSFFEFLKWKSIFLIYQP